MKQNDIKLKQHMMENLKCVICCLIISLILFSGSINAFGAPMDITVPYAVLREGYSDAEFDHLTYDDSFFEESSGKYDHDLALMSYGLSMASFGRKEAPADKNIKTLFEKMGFDMDSYVSYGFDKEDTDEPRTCTSPFSNRISALSSGRPTDPALLPNSLLELIVGEHSDIP